MEGTSAAGWERTLMDWQWPEDLIAQIKEMGFGEHVVHFLHSATISEGNPILIVLLDLKDPDSLRYFQGGNYHLSTAALGAAAWPAGWCPGAGAAPPPGVLPPPDAVTSVLMQQAGIGVAVPGQPIFTGTMQAFFKASAAMRASPQFTRSGPAAFAIYGRPVEPPLLTFVLVTSVDEGDQGVWRGFNVGL